MKTAIICAYAGLSVTLAACGKTPAPSAQPSPSAMLVQLNDAYMQNAIAAKREWGGKRLIIGGNVDTVGKSAAGAPEILLTAGPAKTMAVFDLPPAYEAFAAGLRHDAYVELECTVDPAKEGVSGAAYIDCRPTGQSTRR